MNDQEKIEKLTDALKTILFALELSEHWKDTMPNRLRAIGEQALRDVKATDPQVDESRRGSGYVGGF